MAKQYISLYDGTMVRVGQRVERFDKRAAIPEGADENHVKILLDRGMVAEGEPAAGLTHQSIGPVAFDVDEDAAESKSRSTRKS